MEKQYYFEFVIDGFEDMPKILNQYLAKDGYDKTNITSMNIAPFQPDSLVYVCNVTVKK